MTASPLPVHPLAEMIADAARGRFPDVDGELSFELEPGRRGAGAGVALVRDAMTVVPAGRLVVAAVAPGNAASPRALLSAGFLPLGSVQLFRSSPG